MPVRCLERRRRSVRRQTLPRSQLGGRATLWSRGGALGSFRLGNRGAPAGSRSQTGMQVRSSCKLGARGMTKMRWNDPPVESDPARVQRDLRRPMLSDTETARLRGLAWLPIPLGPVGKALKEEAAHRRALARERKAARKEASAQTDTTPLTPTPKSNAAASPQPEKIEPSPPHLREAKQRFLDAAKVVDSAKQNLKQAERVRTKAQNEYQGLLQSERNSTKYVHDSEHGQRQRHPASRNPR